MFSPGGLGGSFQFSVVKDIPLRTSSIIVDMTGPFLILCDTRTCTTKVWVLLILNPATQFLELEILDDPSSASIVSALIRFMSHHGSKNIFLSDMGSNFWPLATKYATVPDEEIKKLPPMWKSPLSKDIETLSSYGGYLWLHFSTGRNQAVGRIELMVNKLKKYL